MLELYNSTYYFYGYYQRQEIYAIFIEERKSLNNKYVYTYNSFAVILYWTCDIAN